MITTLYGEYIGNLVGKNTLHIYEGENVTFTFDVQASGPYKVRDQKTLKIFSVMILYYLVSRRISSGNPPSSPTSLLLDTDS